MKPPWIAWGLLLAAAMPGRAQEPETFPVMITPSRSARFELDLRLGNEKKKKDRAKVEASRALRKTVLPATIAEDVHAQGCLILRKGAAARVEILDASAPVKGGTPGFIQLKVVALEFEGAELREWDGGDVCVVGKDLSDKGKRLFVLPRKGGGVELSGADPPLEIALLAGQPPEPACGIGGEEGQKEKPAGGEQEPEPRKRVLIPKEYCNRGG